MRVKHRLVCPKCGKGFIVNPKPREINITVIGEPTVYTNRETPVPRCSKCAEMFYISINTETLEIEINDIHK